MVVVTGLWYCVSIFDSCPAASSWCCLSRFVSKGFVFMTAPASTVDDGRRPSLSESSASSAIFGPSRTVACRPGESSSSVVPTAAAGLSANVCLLLFVSVHSVTCILGSQQPYQSKHGEPGLATKQNTSHCPTAHQKARPAAERFIRDNIDRSRFAAFIGTPWPPSIHTDRRCRWFVRRKVSRHLRWSSSRDSTTITASNHR